MAPFEYRLRQCDYTNPHFRHVLCKIDAFWRYFDSFFTHIEPILSPFNRFAAILAGVLSGCWVGSEWVLWVLWPLTPQAKPLANRKPNCVWAPNWILRSRSASSLMEKKSKMSGKKKWLYLAKKTNLRMCCARLFDASLTCVQKRKDPPVLWNFWHFLIHIGPKSAYITVSNVLKNADHHSSELTQLTI